MGIAAELTKYCNLIVVTTEGGYTTDYLSSGMSSVLHGLTGRIDADRYPPEFKKEDILPSTIHNVAATTSDLRRVYNLEQDPEETAKIFNDYKNEDLSQNVSMYIPTNDNDDDSDIDFNEISLDDEEFFDEKKMKKKKHKKRDHKKKKKKKKKKTKTKKEKVIDLTNEDEMNSNSNQNEQNGVNHKVQ